MKVMLRYLQRNDNTMPVNSLHQLQQKPDDNGTIFSKCQEKRTACNSVPRKTVIQG